MFPTRRTHLQTKQLGQENDGQGRFYPFKPGTCTSFSTDFNQAFFWFTFDWKYFSGNRNGRSSRYQRSPNCFYLQNYPQTFTNSGMAFNSFSEEISYLCFLPLDFPEFGCYLQSFVFNSHFLQFYLFYGSSHFIHTLEEIMFFGNFSLNTYW